MFMYPIQIHAYLWQVHRSLFSGEMDIKTQTSNSLSLALWMQNQIQIEWCGTNEQKFAEYKQKSFMNIANSNIESEANEALDAW